MRSILLSTAAAAVLIGTVAVAATTKATDSNRGPMAAFILSSVFITAPALLITASKTEA